MTTEDDDKEKRLKAILNQAKPKKRRRKSPSIKIKGDGNIVGDGNILAGGDVNINTRKTVRHEFRPGPEHISEATAKKIQDLVANLVGKEEAGGMKRSQAFAKWYGLLKNRYNVTTYKAIPAHLGDEAISWLRQQSAIKRSKIRRNDTSKWRKELYTSIWARANELGMSKGEVYALVADRLGKRVTSLTKLGERSLKKLYHIIMSLNK